MEIQGGNNWILSSQGGIIIQFSSWSNIKNYEFASVGFTICPHRTSLTFDLTSDQEKLPGKGKNPSGEQQKRILYPDGQTQ